MWNVVALTQLYVIPHPAPPLQRFNCAGVCLQCNLIFRFYSMGSKCDNSHGIVELFSTILNCSSVKVNA